MHSRVAAVKAPRTHNRRRVTGSSGRRREGRESKLQRPNMSRRVFNSSVLLLVVVMWMCCGTGGDAAAEELPQSCPGCSSGRLFVWRNTTPEETVDSLYAPSLVEMNGGVFAVAEALCTKSENSGCHFTGIASELLTSNNENPEELDKKKLKTQVLEECSSDKTKCPSQNAFHDGSQEVKNVHVSRPTTVVKGDGIYMLVGKYSRTAVAGARESGADDWGLLLVKGEVSGEDESNKQIEWKDTNAVSTTPFGEQLSSLTRLIGGGGSGVKMKDGTLVFPVEAEKEREADKTEEDGKTTTVSLLLYSSDAESWTLSKGMSAEGCSAPSVVEWKEEDKLMMMTACGDGRRRVYESGDKGESWTEALGTLSRVWGNKHKGEGEFVRSGFITATFGSDNKEVMLVTLPVHSKENQKEKEKDRLHLWLTDNTHIADIGPISGEDDEDVAASSLLYKGITSGTDGNNKREELIALYEKKGGGEKPSNSLWSVRLTEQLQRVKDVLATWKEVDEHVSQLCPSESAVQVTSPDNDCRTAMPTAGLVGFLSGNFSDKTWKDEYLGVNATVKENEGAEKAANGVTFKRRTAWAEWPVGSQGENQPYHFANYNFTLVATMSIQKVQEGDTSIPLMGVKMKDAGNPVLLGLSYNGGGKWILLCGDGKTPKHRGTWDSETDTTQYQVAIVLQNGTRGSAYVDGKRVRDEQCEVENKDLTGISHFYIGGDGSSTERREDVSVTVTNVLLYNRPLNGNEITALNAKKAPIPPPKGRPTHGTAIGSSLGGDRQSEHESLKTSGAGGLSASAVSTATSSSAGEKSVKQSVSGTSSVGTQLMDSASSPGGDKAVGTGARKTVTGDGSPQTPVNTPAAADTNAHTAGAMGQHGTAVNHGTSASSGADGEAAGGADGNEEEIRPQVRDVNATALGSILGNLSQGNNTDAGTMRERRVLPLLSLLLGLWGFAAL
ncbi:trans-sialidase [Trypanosoma cruzi]|nr:trans-sialidase [Trypanosoma cruzi]